MISTVLWMLLSRPVPGSCAEGLATARRVWTSWSPSPAGLLDCLLFTAGAVLLIGTLRLWSGHLRWNAALGLTGITYLFFAVPLTTPAVQVPVDLLHRSEPWYSGPRSSAQARPDGASAQAQAPAAAHEPRPRARNSVLTDVVYYFLPARTMVRERLLKLEAPLWTNEIGTGQPLLGSAQPAPFAPLHLMALPLPPVRAMTVSAAWQVLIALLLSYLLLDELGAGRTGAWFGAIAFAFCSYQVVWLYWPHAMVAAWLPGVFLSLHRVHRGRRGGVPGLVFFVTAMLCSGQPQTVAHAALAAGIVWLWCVARPNRLSRQAFTVRSLAAALAILCFSAPVILPLAEAIPQSERMQRRTERLESGGKPRFRAEKTVLTVQPLALGSPRDKNWEGSPNYNELSSSYAGLLTLCIGIAGAIAFRGRVALVVVLGGVFLLTAWAVPPFRELLTSLPLFATASNNRLTLFWDLAISLAAGLSLQRIAGSQRARWVTILLLASAAFAVIVIRPALESPWQLLWRWTVLCSLWLAATLLLVPRWRRFFPGLAVVLLTVDLFLLGVRYNPVVPAEYDLAAPQVVEYLQKAQEETRPFRILALGERFSSNTPAIYGLWDPRGLEPMRPWGAAHLLRERLDRPPFSGRIRQRTDILDRPMHNYLAVRYMLAGEKRSPPPPWRVVFRGKGNSLWENPEALPLFFLSRHLLATPDQETAFRFALRSQDFSQHAAVEGLGVPLGPQRGEVLDVEARSNGFRLRVESATTSIVVSSVTWMPGWRASPDSVRIMRVNGAFLGLLVPKSTTHVKLEYAPSSWLWSWIVFGSGALATIAYWVLRRRVALLGALAGGCHRAR